MHTEMILNSELLTDEYGEWPSFHDSEILKVSVCLAEYLNLGKRTRVLIDVNVYLVKQINEGTVDFEIVKDRENVVTFAFNNVEDLKVNNFNNQNIIDDIHFDEYLDFISVDFITNIGAEISLKCTEATILKMTNKRAYDA